METRRIGELEVSVVGLGCNNFGSRIDRDRTQQVVDAAIDAGVTYFDTAEAYGDGRSEELLGAALGGRRADVVIATKWGLGRTGDGPRPGEPVAIRQALEASLRRLGTEYVDHYQLHQPDPRTPVAETLGALAELRTEGKVREIGCSNFDAAQLDAAAGAASTRGVPPFASVQNHYSLLTRDPETNGVLDACARHGIALVPYFPLESGVLTGKFSVGEPPPAGTRIANMGERAQRFYNEERLVRVAELTRWASARGRTILELAMSWLTSNGQVASVIAGATSADQVRTNVQAASWSMTADERAELERH